MCRNVLIWPLVAGLLLAVTGCDQGTETQSGGTTPEAMEQGTAPGAGQEEKPASE